MVKGKSFQMPPLSATEARVLRDVERLVQPHHAQIEPLEPLTFEQITKGMTFKTPFEEITRFRHELHRISGGVAWRHFEPGFARQKNFPGIPASSQVVLGVAEAHLSRLGVLPVEFLYKQEIPKFEQPVFVGNRVRVETTVLRKWPHRDSSKDYGFVRVRQSVFNESGKRVFRRLLTYTITR